MASEGCLSVALCCPFSFPFFEKITWIRFHRKDCPCLRCLLVSQNIEASHSHNFNTKISKLSVKCINCTNVNSGLTKYLHVGISWCYLLHLWLCREIDETLRPGVYALIDACSPDDLQYLHTVFGGKQFLFWSVLWEWNQKWGIFFFCDKIGGFVFTCVLYFVEGPCRNTLADLQRDYKLNYKYEGKVWLASFLIPVNFGSNLDEFSLLTLIYFHLRWQHAL